MITTLSAFAGRFGIDNKEAERFLKFAVVGGIGFIVDFGVLNLLLGPFTFWLSEGQWLFELLTGWGLAPGLVMGLAPAFAGTISFVAAVVSNFLWNRYWTYPDSRSKAIARQFAQFTLVSVAGILIRIPVITVASRYFTNLLLNMPRLAPYAARIGANLALAVAVVIVLFWNFFINRYWTYGDVD